ncbi:auxin efflux carrier transmembrane protein [Imleria badia]|nr:auxin efflux carrier transmembrane protein [Imleria badia]
MIPASELIWVSAQPLIRLFLCVAGGFIITKAGLLPPLAARSTGQIALNITLPSLLFSRIVPVFNSSNVSALGPIVLVALLYEAIGIAMSCIIKQVFWVPHRFRYGILVAGGWGNVGDIPLSVLMSLTAAAPFNGASDQNLAVAYIAVFNLVFLITLFPLGGLNWVAMDFQGPDVIDGDVQEQLKTKHQYLGVAIERAVISSKGLFFPRRPQEDNSDYDDEKAVASTRRLSDPPSLSVGLHDDPTSAGTTIVQHTTEVAETTNEPAAPLRRRLARLGSSFLQTLIMPCSLSIIGSFIISIIPALKALFVPDVPGVNMTTAPDGQPPLAIILNTATFIGGASIPLGLIIIGSALARMEVPGGSLRSLPLGAASALAIGRLVIMPVFGVLITQGLTQAGLLDVNDNVLRFVCIFLSCLPSATTQVLLTQVYSGTGNAQHLSVFLIPQYILMFVTMTALTAYTLHLLFS